MRYIAELLSDEIFFKPQIIFNAKFPDLRYCIVYIIMFLVDYKHTLDQIHSILQISIYLVYSPIVFPIDLHDKYFPIFDIPYFIVCRA